MKRKPYTLVLAYDAEGNPEITHELYPHTGNEGQEADLKIFAFADTLDDDTPMNEVLAKPEYREVVCLTLDIEPDSELYNSLSGPELFSAFMEGLQFRIAPLRRKDFQEATKK